MLDMAAAHDFGQRIAACMVAVGTSASGLIAQAARPPGSDSNLPELGVYAGVTYLIIAVIREGSPPLQKLIETMATARNERVRMEAQIDGLRRDHDADARRIADLEVKLVATDERARKAENDLENAKIAGDARAQAIEDRAREAGHLARNNAQRIANFVDQINGGGSGSGDRDPESVL